MKYNKKKVKVPLPWSKHYPGSKFKVIHLNNYLDFITTPHSNESSQAVPNRQADELRRRKRFSGSKPLSRWKQWTAGIPAGKTLDLIYIFQK
jgi:hypothetical protein